MIVLDRSEFRADAALTILDGAVFTPVVEIENTRSGHTFCSRVGSKAQGRHIPAPAYMSACTPPDIKTQASHVTFSFIQILYISQDRLYRREASV